jgi:hypothetical protein
VAVPSRFSAAFRQICPEKQHEARVVAAASKLRAWTCEAHRRPLVDAHFRAFVVAGAHVETQAMLPRQATIEPLGSRLRARQNVEGLGCGRGWHGRPAGRALRLELGGCRGSAQGERRDGKPRHARQRTDVPAPSRASPRPVLRFRAAWRAARPPARQARSRQRDPARPRTRERRALPRNAGTQPGRSSPAAGEVARRRTCRAIATAANHMGSRPVNLSPKASDMVSLSCFPPPRMWPKLILVDGSRATPNEALAVGQP